MKTRLLPTLCIALVTSLFAHSAVFSAPPSPASWPPRFDPLRENPALELQKVEALQVKVSLEAKRMPLNELLATLQQQSGVALQSSEAFPAAKTLVTLRVREMSLASFMGALSRTYGVHWRENNGGWQMQPSDQSALLFKLQRASGLRPENDIEQREIVRQQQDDWAKEIYFSVDENVWSSPQDVKLDDLPPQLQQSMLVKQGVSVKGLPDEIQAAIHRRINASLSSQLIERYRQTLLLKDEKLVLKLSKINPDTPVFFAQDLNIMRMMPREFAPVQLAVYTTDGRFVANVFRTFRPVAPDEAQKEPQPQAEIPVPAGR